VFSLGARWADRQPQFFSKGLRGALNWRVRSVGDVVAVAEGTAEVAGKAREIRRMT
jgi:hypothetical protein